MVTSKSPMWRAKQRCLALQIELHSNKLLVVYLFVFLHVNKKIQVIFMFYILFLFKSYNKIQDNNIACYAFDQQICPFSTRNSTISTSFSSKALSKNVLCHMSHFYQNDNGGHVMFCCLFQALSLPDKTTTADIK